MKALLISAAFILTTVSFGSTAYANVNNGGTQKFCQSIPPARPSGGATRQRLQTMQRCNPRVRQLAVKSNTEICQFVALAEPTGGATRQRLQAMQRCNSRVR